MQSQKNPLSTFDKDETREKNGQDRVPDCANVKSQFPWAFELNSILLGDYELIAKIGHGAQADVYQALSKSGKTVAIKVFDFRNAESWKSLDLLKREVSTLRYLKVKGIPKYIDFIEYEPYSFLVESYIPAPSLKELMNDGFRPTEKQVCTIMRKAAKILSDLHSQLTPVIHRDIKPGNILVDIAENHLKVWIIDFGAVTAQRYASHASTLAGTAGYAAPEQLYGRATPASDIYGLGMTMIHLLTGVAPWEMDMDGLSLLYEKYLPKNMSSKLKWLLADMVEPDPKKRINSADKVLERLSGILKDEKKDLPKVDPPPTPKTDYREEYTTLGMTSYKTHEFQPQLSSSASQTSSSDTPIPLVFDGTERKPDKSFRWGTFITSIFLTLALGGVAAVPVMVFLKFGAMWGILLGLTLLSLIISAISYMTRSFEFPLKYILLALAAIAIIYWAFVTLTMFWAVVILVLVASVLIRLYAAISDAFEISLSKLLVGGYLIAGGIALLCWDAKVGIISIILFLIIFSPLIKVFFFDD